MPTNHGFSAEKIKKSILKLLTGGYILEYFVYKPYIRIWHLKNVSTIKARLFINGYGYTI